MTSLTTLLHSVLGRPQETDTSALAAQSQKPTPGSTQVAAMQATYNPSLNQAQPQGYSNMNIGVQPINPQLWTSSSTPSLHGPLITTEYAAKLHLSMTIAEIENGYVMTLAGQTYYAATLKDLSDRLITIIATLEMERQR